MKTNTDFETMALMASKGLEISSSTHLVSAESNRLGGHIKMGVDAATVIKLTVQPGQYIPILYVVNRDQFFATKGDGRPYTGAELIAIERDEQINKHGWDATHDDYTNGQLVEAAHYCLGEGVWPKGWDEYFADKIANNDRISQLKKAGAFIAAEIDRLQREDLKSNINDKP